MNASLKPWLSFEKQLDKLISNGLQVSDTAKALDYLERLGYYRLSGYWYPLRTINEESSLQENKPIRTSKFVEGSTFQDIVYLYIFDKKLRLLALDALERIEMAVRVDIAYLLGKYDPLAHKKPKFLHGRFAKQIKKRGPAEGKTEHQMWLEKYQAQVKRARREPFIAHNIEKYGEPSIWVAIEVWDFGLMSKLFSGMKINDRNKIAKKYGAKDGEEFSSWLRSLNFIRNVSAHHSRLWNINVLERSSIPVYDEQWSSLNNSRPFFYFCLMQKMLLTICPNSKWSQRFKRVCREFPSNKNLNIKDFGTVTGWENWGIWR